MDAAPGSREREKRKAWYLVSHAPLSIRGLDRVVAHVRAFYSGRIPVSRLGNWFYGNLQETFLVQFYRPKSKD